MDSDSLYQNFGQKFKWLYVDVQVKWKKGIKIVVFRPIFRFISKNIRCELGNTGIHVM